MKNDPAKNVYSPNKLLIYILDYNELIKNPEDKKDHNSKFLNKECKIKKNDEFNIFFNKSPNIILNNLEEFLKLENK
jgi:hypothetical protein